MSKMTQEEYEAWIDLPQMARTQDPPRLVDPITSLDQLIVATPFQLFNLVDHFGFMQLWQVWPLIPEVVRHRIYAFINGIPPIEGAVKEYGDWQDDPERVVEKQMLDVFNNVVLVIPTNPAAAEEYGIAFKESPY